MKRTRDFDGVRVLNALAKRLGYVVSKKPHGRAAELRERWKRWHALSPRAKKMHAQPPRR